MCSQLSAIDVTAKTFFERLYLVLVLRIIAPWVNCPHAPTTPTIHPTFISRFLCNFSPNSPSFFFWHHDSPSNLAESRYLGAGGKTMLNQAVRFILKIVRFVDKPEFCNGANRVLVIRLVQWLGWVFENKERKKARLKKERSCGGWQAAGYKTVAQ